MLFTAGYVIMSGIGAADIGGSADVADVRTFVSQLSHDWEN